jgi:hypothetical protein
MVGHEGRGEVIAVVVARLHPQRQVDPGRIPCRLQQFGAELFD